jgi:hypothetical protein
MHIKQITRIEGVFSGTLSYIFNEFSTGSADGPSFSTVVRTARDKGYTVRSSSISRLYHPPNQTPDRTDIHVCGWCAWVHSFIRNLTQQTI